MSLLAVLISCGPTFSYTPRVSGAPTTAKAVPCNFDVTATLPASGYEEIGLLDRTWEWAKTAQDFKDAVQEAVCNAGGDLVVTEVNAVGNYVRGVVLRKTESPVPPSP